MSSRCWLLGLPDAVRATPKATEASRPLTPRNPTAAAPAVVRQLACQAWVDPQLRPPPEAIHLTGEVGCQQG